MSISIGSIRRLPDMHEYVVFGGVLIEMELHDCVITEGYESNTDPGRMYLQVQAISSHAIEVFTHLI